MDFGEYQDNISFYFFVLKSNDAIPKFFKLACSLLILCLLLFMNTAIYFYHQSLFGAIIIGNEWTGAPAIYGLTILSIEPSLLIDTLAATDFHISFYGFPGKIATVFWFS